MDQRRVHDAHPSDQIGHLTERFTVSRFSLFCGLINIYRKNKRGRKRRY